LGLVRATTANLGFLLAKASQRWNELLVTRFAAGGFPEVRPSYGSVLLPLFEQDGLRMGGLAERSQLSKQSITKLVALCERDQLVTRERDQADGRAYRVHLTSRARTFQSLAESVLAELDSIVLNALGRRQTDALRSALKGLAEL
jgi:MarR family transcriptional regulator, organic hydroperoxide resistance regulator